MTTLPIFQIVCIFLQVRVVNDASRNKTIRGAKGPNTLQKKETKRWHDKRMRKKGCNRRQAVQEQDTQQAE
jgi:hypothetical protein